MKFNRIGRILVCLVLICALVINISPIKARALSPLVTAVLWVSATAVVAGCLQALGHMCAESTAEVFDDVVNDAVAWLEQNTSYVVDGMIQVTGLLNGDVATWQSFLPKALLETLLFWSFDSGTVCPKVGSLAAGSTYALYNYGTYTLSGPGYVFKFNYKDADNYNYHRYFHVIVCDGNMKNSSGNLVSSTVSVNGVTYSYVSVDAHTDTMFNKYAGIKSGSYYFGTLSQGSSTANIKYAISVVINGYLSGGYDGLYSPDGLLLGNIEPLAPGLQIGDLDSYLNYGQSMITAPGYAYADPELGQQEIDYLPVSIPSQKYEDVQMQTQEEAQLGQTELEFEAQDQTEVQTQGLLQNILQSIIQLPGKIFDGLGQVLIDALSYLFVPRQEFVQTKVQTLTQEFAFASSLVTTGKAITSGLSGIATEPPIIYIDLSANRGSHYLGGRTVFMDLSWYAEYKSTVDTLISAFLWICFVWRMLLKLPGIIGGMPGDFVYGAAHTLGLDNHLPTRNAAYEVTRAANREYIRKGPGK